MLGKTLDALTIGLGLGLVLAFAPGAWAQVDTPPDADGDGIADEVDTTCPTSNVASTVVIDSCDSLVPNTVFPNGCTLADRIAACAVDVKNHGKYVSCVARLTNSLKRTDVITGKQKGAIQRCAAQADIP